MSKKSVNKNVFRPTSDFNHIKYGLPTLREQAEKINRIALKALRKIKENGDNGSQAENALNKIKAFKDSIKVDTTAEDEYRSKWLPAFGD